MVAPPRVLEENLWHRSWPPERTATRVTRIDEGQVVGRDESPTDERSVLGVDSLKRSSDGLLAAEHLQGPETMTAFQNGPPPSSGRATVPQHGS